MKKSKLVLLNLAIILIAVSALVLVASKMASNKLIQSLPSPILSLGPDLSGLIRLEKPGPSQLIASPLLVAGEARGYWFFEASFPVRIYDANGVELGVVPAQAQKDPVTGEINWMTTDFVPFQATLYFKKPVTATGTLILEKDNPSGLPENSAELIVPVVFNLEGWLASPEPTVERGQDNPIVSGGCKITGCSGQICAEEEVITTCEFLPEYACYKTARCERQSDGKCDWTPTEELVACLKT